MTNELTSRFFQFAFISPETNLLLASHKIHFFVLLWAVYLCGCCKVLVKYCPVKNGLLVNIFWPD